MKTWIVVDVEADGPCAGPYSMVSFGAVLVADTTKTFYGKVAPISEKYVPEALAVSGISREEHETYDSPEEVMIAFAQWLKSVCKGQPKFISDNNGFDWQWINYYFHVYYGSNPFGHSSRRIGDLYCGLVKDVRKNRDWKRLRITKHTHNPVDDAMGNAEALHAIKELGLHVNF